MYLKKLVWPMDLSISYLYHNIAIWHLFLSAIFLIMITILVCKYFKKYPYLPVGWFWCLGTLIPVLGIVHLFASVLIIVFLSAATYHQTKLWANTATLFDDALKKDPNNYVAYAVMGREMLNNGENEKALYCYDMALKLNPRFYGAYINEGLVLMTMGKRYDALKFFEKAMRLDKYQADAYYDIGKFYMADNKLDESIPYFIKAVEIKPDYKEAYNDLRVVLVKKGRIGEGILQFEKALHINPYYKDSRKNLQIALEMNKKNKNSGITPR